MNRVGRELVAGKLVVALDGAGDKGSEVEHVKQVGAEADVAPLIAFPGFDDQMKDAEKDVGKPKRKVRIMEEEARGKEGVFLKPDIDKDDRDDRQGQSVMGGRGFDSSRMRLGGGHDYFPSMTAGRQRQRPRNKERVRSLARP